jgi:hypothetical protein
MALWKIAGLVVTPATPISMKRASSPELMRARDRLSSQICWPAARAAWIGFMGSGLAVEWVRVSLQFWPNMQAEESDGLPRRPVDLEVAGLIAGRAAPPAMAGRRRSSSGSPESWPSKRGCWP